MIPNYADYLQWVQQQNVMQTPPVPQTGAQPIVAFVANKTAADLFNVNPGQKAVLIDMDLPYVYYKERSQDNKLQPLQWFDLTPHKEQAAEPVSLDGFVKEEDIRGKYVKREDLNRIIAQEVDKRMSECFSKPNKRRQED